MKTSFLINVHNEPQALRKTIANIQQDMEGEDHNFFIFADGYQETFSDPRICVLTSPNPIGCGKAKVKLTEASDGDILVYMDAHHWLQYGSYKHLIKTAIEKQAFVHPIVYSIQYDEKWNVSLKNERPKVPTPWINVNCVAGNLLQNVRLNDWKNKITNHIGACVAPYVVPRNIIEKIGGWNEYPYRHGAQELGMALRAIVCDVPRYIDGFVGVGHAFSKFLRFKGVMDWHQQGNLFYAWMVCLTDKEFDEWIKPTLKSKYPKHRHINEIRNDPNFRRQQEQLLKLRKKLPVLYDKKTFGGWSLGYEAFDWIVQNVPSGSNVVELGSGRISELLAYRYKLLSIEHDDKFINKYHTNYIHAPLKNNWYDSEKIHGLSKNYDLLIIDGPYEAVSDRSILLEHWHLFGKPKRVFIDDSQRESAQKILAYLCERGYRVETKLDFSKKSVVLKRA